MNEKELTREQKRRLEELEKEIGNRIMQIPEMEPISGMIDGHGTGMGKELQDLVEEFRRRAEEIKSGKQ